MTLEDLHVLTVVADQLNLSAAARALGCTQSAVSQHIKRLEAEVGSPLLARGRRAVRELADPGLGVLRIATGGFALRHFMAPAIGAFRADHPDTRVELHSAGSGRRCLQAVQRDQADLAFVTLGDSLSGFATKAIVESDWTLVEPLAAAGRPAGPIGVDELARVEYISLHPGSVTGRELSRQLRSAHIDLDIETTVDDWDTAIALVDLGLGVAIVPALHAVALQRSYRFTMTPIAGLAPLRFGWAATDPRLLPASAQEFARILGHGQSASPLVRSLGQPWEPRASRPAPAR